MKQCIIKTVFLLMWLTIATSSPHFGIYFEASSNFYNNGIRRNGPVPIQAPPPRITHIYRNHFVKKIIQAPSPIIQMVDITNLLGFRILAIHSVDNVNNIAFSPCGLGSVLVSLFEGSDGQSSFEIFKSIQFPAERDIIRIGYRDIHRRLRVS